MQTSQLKDLGTVSVRAMVCLLAEEILSPILQLLPFLLGSPIRWIFLKIFSKKAGRQIFIAQNVSLRHCYNLRIGDYVGINQDVILHCRGGVTIGNHVFFGQGVMINTGDHYYMDREKLIRDQGAFYKAVTIGNDVFLGMGAIILPGVNVADGTVVAAGAVVTRDTEPYSVVAGVPARIMKFRTKINPSSTSQ